MSKVDWVSTILVLLIVEIIIYGIIFGCNIPILCSIIVLFSLYIGLRYTRQKGVENDRKK